MPRLLQLVHGFPPRENAGTEQYAARVARGLGERGWEVHTLAATQAPGTPMYTRQEAPGLTRLVQNTPYRGLRHAEQDPAVDRVVEELAARLRPDVVHVQHLLGLSTGWRVDAPVVWTLHDAWGWCAAGGQLLRDGRACPGPGPGCAACASAWARDGAFVEAAVGAAGAASRWVAPERLHRAWRRLPGGLRERVSRAGVRPLTGEEVEARTAALRGFARRTALRLAPSRWLAEEAERRGLGRVEHHPHGVERGLAPRPDPLPRDAPFVFLGTLAPHKGPALVRRAWERAGRPAPLWVHGPPGPDAAYVAALPNDGAVPTELVPALLAGARALVMGSVWPENAPLVVLEARAVGCPVVAPAVGGLPELVEEGVDGWLYPPGDEAALAALLRRVTTSGAAARLPVRPPPSFAEHLDALLGRYAALGVR